MKIAEAIDSVEQLYIEAAPLIYFVENHPKYGDLVDAIFAHVELRSVELLTSVILITEVLVKPLKANDAELTNAYRVLLQNHIQLRPVSESIASKAAQLRATYSLRTPDALHIATAIDTKCDAFLTNDKALKRVADMQIIVLDDIDLGEQSDPENESPQKP